MADEIPEEYTANYEQFRDILSSFLIERLAAPLSKPKPKPKRRSKNPSSGPANSQADNAEAEPSADDLAEFTSYIATAPPSPSPLTPSSHSTLLALALPSTAEFLAPVLTAYLTATTTPPPPPRSTRAQATACELCARAWVPLTYHHLVPRMVHEKAVRRGWHRAGDLQNVAWLCAACHRFVHRFRGHEELAREFYTVERLLAAEEVQRFVGWVGRVRWKKR
ncbi:f7094fab-6c9e-48ed-94bb-b51fef505c2a [Thermothielavioides terrestris]|uniref:F7094fab-6c9e-48ed-94bb-b51fef505c2a n=1 Tax=Thermothielavioides terrestris TaxID=2587410 RepID=A0A3S4C9A0_9PEZI|nr:f7094fab-6c9e-48ed-94bb-b51fef505c2a [Thermothielavioides terrestris]